MKKYLFSGFETTEDDAFFILDDIDATNNDRITKSIYGAPFTFSKMNERFCVGRYDLDTFNTFSCPIRYQLDDTHKGNICMDCFRFNAFNPSFYHVKPHEISAKQRRYNLAPHNVYLVYFSPKHVKVGISHHQRTMTRWLEQGARFAKILYTCSNAYEARELEETLVGLSGVFEAVRAEQKRELLKRTLDPQLAQNIMAAAISRIEKTVQKPVLIGPVLALDQFFLHENISGDIIDVSEHTPLTISGTAQGMVGDILVYSNSGQQFMVSLKKLVGRQVMFAAEMTRQDFKPTQISLF